MEFIKNIFKDKKNCILAAIIASVLGGFLIFDYYEDGFYANDSVYKSKNIEISYNDKVQSNTDYQSLWWEQDLWGNLMLNKSAELTNKKAEVYLKTGWNETQSLELSQEKIKKVSCYGPTLLGARLDAGIYDVDSDGKKEQVYYYTQIAANDRGLDGDEDQDGDASFDKKYNENSVYMNSKYKNLTFENIEKMSLGIIPLDEGYFQILFNGEVLSNKKIKVISETGINEVVTTNADGYVYIKDLRASTNGINIIYVEDTSDTNTYHILNYKVDDLDGKGVFAIGSVVLLIIVTILGVFGVNKLLLQKRNNTSNELLFEMDDIKKEDK